ncbi:hypothetical protein [Streptomyces sp. NPDC048172]|uniref:hypothetical protein n=1 Tax=Streptomyces sp. NPDC048172 TaxID=3365505 RepID=UPI003724874F
MTRNRHRTTPVLAAALVLGTVLAGCGGGGEDDKSPRAASSPAPHGYVKGAEEAAEQQSRLVLTERGSGKVRLLDLVEGKTRTLGRADGVSGLVTDGRFAYVNSGGGTQVFDSGAWMVDHGDHVHYYRAKPRSLGRIPGGKPEHVYSSPSLTAVTFADGTAKLLDHARLEKGKLRTTATLDDARRGPVVPYEEHALIPVPGPGGKTAVEVRDAKGESVTTLKEPCPDLRGSAVTRRGAVFGCADGALFVKEKSGELVAEKIPFGRKVSAKERPESFQHRSQGTTLAARAGDSGVWLLDVAERRWQLVKTGPVTAVNAPGDGAPLLALDRSGNLTSYEMPGGKRLASRKVLAEPHDGKGAAPVIEVDASRAYVNDAAAKKIHEIDYNDNLREARSFPLGFSPARMVETGR